MAHDGIILVNPQMDRAYLLYRIAGRDRAALKSLYDDIGPKLFALLVRASDNREMAEGLLVDTFVGIWRTAHLFAESPANADIWLFHAARATAFDFKMRNKTSDVTRDV